MGPALAFVTFLSLGVAFIISGNLLTGIIVFAYLEISFGTLIILMARQFKAIDNN